MAWLALEFAPMLAEAAEKRQKEAGSMARKVGAVVDAEPRPEMAAQPRNAHQVCDVRARDEEVAPAAHEIGRVEDGLELADGVAHGLPLLQIRLTIGIVVERVGELRARR